MNAEARIPFLPGERVRLKRNVHRYILRGVSGWIDYRKVYHVRSSFFDRRTGEECIRLSGVFAPLDADGCERGIPAEHFESKGRPAAAYIPELEEICHVEVRIPAAVANVIQGLPMTSIISEFLPAADGALSVVCKNWDRAWRVSKSFSEMHREIATAVESSPSVVYCLPLTPLMLQALGDICQHLAISPEAWLQGALGNLGIRFRKLQEEYARGQRLLAKLKNRSRPND